jgi:hypothetical protein
VAATFIGEATSTVPSTANLQVVAACSVWLSVNTGSQSWGIELIL